MLPSAGEGHRLRDVTRLLSHPDTHPGTGSQGWEAPPTLLHTGGPPSRHPTPQTLCVVPTRMGGLRVASLLRVPVGRLSHPKLEAVG